MNIESGLISKIETKEDLLYLIDERVTHEFFEEHKDIYKAILDYYGKYHTVPEKDTLSSLFPNFQFIEDNEPLEFYADKIKEKFKKNILSEGIIDAAQLLKTNVDEAEKFLQQTLIKSKNSVRTGSDVSAQDVVTQIKERYEKREQNLGIDGYETPWARMNDLTCGYHNGELVVFTAKPKKCKSWLLIYQAQYIWRNSDVPIVFVTKEMSQLAIFERLFALESRLPYDAIKKGTLSSQQKTAFFSYMDELTYSKVPFIVTGYDLSDNISGVSSLIPRVERYLGEGGLLFVDGIYLMPDDRGEKDWKAIVNVSSDLKNIGLSYDIPVIATTQHNMEDKNDIPRMDGIAYGKYLVQFVDALIGISRSDSDKELDRGKLHILAQREGDIGDFLINMKFNPIDFSQTFERTVEDLEPFDYDDEEDEVMKY